MIAGGARCQCRSAIADPNCQSPIPNPQAPSPKPQSPITNHQSPITNHQSPAQLAPRQRRTELCLQLLRLRQRHKAQA
ncbi:hypothetical protein E1J25_20190 [Xanthomonas hortorum pv. taraxaci]|nr:hypothetical protein [Xanthomonas hortorum pv. taraxaci]